MPVRTDSGLDLLPVRALLVAGTSLALAVGGHALAGGGSPRSALAVAVLVASTLPAAVWLARHRLTLPRLVPVLGALQLLLHTELSVLAAHSGGGRPVAGGPHAHHAVGGAGSWVTRTTTSSADAAAQGLHGDVPVAVMLAAHAVAVVAVALVLASGDRAAESVLTWLSLVALLVRTTHGPAPVHRRRSTVVDSLLPGRAPARLARTALRFRGPPPGGHAAVLRHPLTRAATS